MIRKYVGILDDKVIAYPWDYMTIGKDQVEQTIFRPAVFPNECLIINDGYALLNDTIRSQLTNAISPLRVLLSTGHAKIMSRGQKSPLDIINARSQNGVASFKELMRSPDWGTIRRDLEGVECSWSNWLVDPPKKDLSHAFYLMMMQLRDRDVGLNERYLEVDFQRLLDEFSRHIDAQGCNSPRTDWENMLGKGPLQQQGRKAAFMRVANEAYHVAVASCLDKHPSFGANDWIGVETRITAACQPFIDASARIVDGGTLSLGSSIVLEVPAVDLADGALMRKLLEDGVEKQRLKATQDAFCKELTDFLNPEVRRQDFSELQAAATNYSRELKRVLSTAASGRRGSVTSTAFDAMALVKDIVSQDVIGLFMTFLGSVPYLMQLLQPNKSMPVLESSYALIVSAPLNRPKVEGFVSAVREFK